MKATGVVVCPKVFFAVILFSSPSTSHPNPTGQVEVCTWEGFSRGDGLFFFLSLPEGTDTSTYF